MIISCEVLLDTVESKLWREVAGHYGHCAHWTAGRQVVANGCHKLETCTHH